VKIFLLTFSKKKNEIAGYFELLFNENNKEAEIAYFGILEEYFGKNLVDTFLVKQLKVRLF